MNNTIGLLLIGLGIGIIVGFVIFVQYMANNHPHSKVGRICHKINGFIDRLPDD